MNKFQIMSALVTPFDKYDHIDYEALAIMIDAQLKQGVDGLIVCGTTAETPTLKSYERFDLLRFVIDRVKHRCEIWFGCGTNNTAETIALVKKSAPYDIDGVLLVTPYYNKPSQQGLYEHFSTIAKYSEHPIMLYQVPARCAVSFTEETLCRLFRDCPNITALKHASDDYDLIADLHEAFPQIRLFSGEDATFYEGMNRGLNGIISVMSNVYLREMKQYVETKDDALRQYLQQAAKLCFLECSPSAVKYVLSRLGYCENRLRLPLVSIGKTSMERIDAFMANDKFHQPLR